MACNGTDLLYFTLLYITLLYTLLPSLIESVTSLVSTVGNQSRYVGSVQLLTVFERYN
jgi:hypothetical protein